MQDTVKANNTLSAQSSLNVLLCPDKPDWAFDNIARNIKRHCRGETIHTLYMRDTLEQEHLFFEKIILNRIDVCHVFWREDLFYLLAPSTLRKAATALNFSYESLVGSLRTCAFTTSVYDHLHSATRAMQARQYDFSMIDGYTVSSQRLFELYTSMPHFPRPDAVIEDGVDTHVFQPRPGNKRQSSAFAIGWAGNSAWGKQALGVDVKGYHEVFVPMMHALRNMGMDVCEKLADPQKAAIPFSEMPDFYRNLDVFVCTSSMEGTPNTLLEAMACGIPIATTDVGIVPQLCGDRQRAFVVKRRDPEEFAKAVAGILRDPRLQTALSEENRERAAAWDWKYKCAGWRPFWRTAFERANRPRNALRREAWLMAYE